MSNNYILWGLALDEGYDDDESGIQVFEVVKKDGLADLFHRFRNEDTDYYVGEVGCHCLSSLSETQYMVITYDDYSDCSYAVIDKDFKEYKQLVDHLNTSSYYNGESRGRRTREGSAFYSKIIDWNGNILFRGDHSNFTDHDEVEDHSEIQITECPSGISWKDIPAISLSGSYSNDDSVVTFEDNITISTKNVEEISLFGIYKELCLLRRCDDNWKTLNKDVFNLICGQIFVYNPHIVHGMPLTARQIILKKEDTTKAFETQTPIFKKWRNPTSIMTQNEIILEAHYKPIAGYDSVYLHLTIYILGGLPYEQLYYNIEMQSESYDPCRGTRSGTIVKSPNDENGQYKIICEEQYITCDNDTTIIVYIGI